MVNLLKTTKQETEHDSMFNQFESENYNALDVIGILISGYLHSFEKKR
jgi:hypothetical protein